MIFPELRLPPLDVGLSWRAPVPPTSWQEWLHALFPATFVGEPATYHAEFWEWVWSVQRGRMPRPFVGVWPRGWGKSTCGEVAAIALGATGRRAYVLYVSATQAQADDHVATVHGRLESREVERYYPDLARRRVDKYGSARGWRRNRLSTAMGLTVDALGLDTAVRGIKLDDERPDIIILDDVDSDEDGMEVVARKIRAVTQRLLPAGSDDVAVLVLQNLVHRNGIVSQLVDGRADFLGDRIVSGPHPAIDGMETEGVGTYARIRVGTPTWSVMGIEECQAKIGLFGLHAFLSECQHEVELSGQSRFSLDALSVMRERCLEPLPARLLPAHLQGVEGLRVYALPKPAAAYVMYIDPAEGKGRDYTATGVMEARSRQLVAVLEDNTREPQAHGELAADLWQWYNSALLAWERAKGEAIAYVLGQRGVTHLYQHEDNPVTPQQRAAGMIPKLRPGFPMTEHTKRGLIDRLGTAIEVLDVGIPDRRTVEQCAAYIVTERMTTQASSGSHDDLVIVVSGCLMLSEVPGAQSVMHVEPRVPRSPVYHEANRLVRRGR